MKKRISCLIALVVMLTASGCGGKGNIENGDNSSNVQQEEKETTIIDSSQATEKKEESIKNPQETENTSETEGKKKAEESKQPDNNTNTKPVANNTKPTPAPTTKPVPTTKPTAKPTTNPKPPVEEVKVAVNDIMNKIVEEVQLPSMVNLKKEEVKDFYYINTDHVEDFIVKVPMMNVMATEVSIIKVKDVKNVENVEEGIKSRVKDLERTWQQYLPKQYELVKNHIIKSNGQYVILIISNDAKKIEETFDGFFKK